jgi:hypothetical protein
MRVGDRLEQEARDVGQWVQEHADEFAPLQIRRVDPPSISTMKVSPSSG